MRLLSADSASLAFEQPGSPPGTIFVRGPRGGVSASPETGARVTFGRNLDEVDVVVAPDDDRVSRCRGVITRAERHWTLRNTGRLPIRLPGSRMVHPEIEPVELGRRLQPRCSSAAASAATTWWRYGSPAPPARPGNGTGT